MRLGVIMLFFAIMATALYGNADLKDDDYA